MPSPLQLESYLIEELSFVTEELFDENLEAASDVDVRTEHYTHKEDPTRHQLRLKIQSLPLEGAEDRCPYRVTIAGRAHFKIADESLDEDARMRLILLNGASILVGLMRAHVAQATAQGPYGVLLLQPVNLVEALEKGAAVGESD